MRGIWNCTLEETPSAMKSEPLMFIYLLLLYLLARSITLYLVILHVIYIEFLVVIFTLRVYCGYSFFMDCY